MIADVSSYIDVSALIKILLIALVAGALIAGSLLRRGAMASLTQAVPQEPNTTEQPEAEPEPVLVGI